MAEPEIRNFFPTPILIQDQLLSDAQNTAIADLILERAARSQSIGRSNVKGWHSEYDFFEWDLPAVRQLHEACKEAVVEITRRTATTKVDEIQPKFVAWANLLNAGSYNAVHDHTDAGWSGVYYVNTGVVTADDGVSGRLEFLDPRAAVTGGFIPGSPFRVDGRVEPRDGRLVIFPGWLKHIVYPFASAGDGVRISVAFNALFDRFAHLKDGAQEP